MPENGGAVGLGQIKGEFGLARLVRKTARVFDGSFQPDKLSHEIAVAADGLLRAYRDEFLDEDGLVRKLASPLIVAEVYGVNVDVVELGEGRFRGIEFVGGERRAHIDPLAIAFGSDEFAGGVEGIIAPEAPFPVSANG